ncbi:MAG: class I SAM-dependent methyltransferase [Erysipelotrichaceae bacterium]|nr:class I SAM-dependent methyltransferase [Erysipelotrichaceae bacterium]
MNNNTFVHKYIKPLIHNTDTTVDMTVGNGNDTLLLSNLSKKVYGFDISIEAIRKTEARLEKNNVILIHDNHINVDKYVKEDIKLFIFNLGYLPHSEDTSCTKAKETLVAFKKAYQILSNGYIVITFYIGHIGGKDEFYLLDSYIKQNKIKIIEKYRQDKINSPITYIIKKKSS